MSITKVDEIRKRKSELMVTSVVTDGGDLGEPSSFDRTLRCSSSQFLAAKPQPGQAPWARLSLFEKGWLAHVGCSVAIGWMEGAREPSPLLNKMGTYRSGSHTHSRSDIPRVVGGEADLFVNRNDVTHYGVDRM